MSTKKETKETKVVKLNPEPIEVNQPKQEQLPRLELSQEDANAYLQVISLIMIGDDRMKSLQTHFVEMLKRNNESLKEQRG